MVPRDAHSISRKSISENALKVLYRLNKAGYEAYLVGGSVRDILLNLSPKDFDVATNATPEQIKKLFRNCRLIGRRFRLAHIIFGKEIIEVATFRGPQSQNEDDVSVVKASHGMLLRDNVYGTIEEDAIRRDFTINSLYYSVADFSIRDYTNGLADLNNKIVKLVGDPDTRYREDPVRMLRAIRFCAKLDMTMDSQTAQPIPHLAHLLTHVPAARLFDESLKLLQTGHGYKTYQLLKEYGLFEFLFPIIARHFTQNQDSHLENIVEQVLKNTDYRLSQNKRINPAFLFAAMLWYPVTELAQKLSQEGGLRYSEAFALAISDILSEQNKTISIPKRFSLIISDIWYLQLRLNKLIGKRPLKILEHPKFRAAFDLLELRSNIEKGETLKLARWWDNFQHVSPTEQLDILNNPECKLSTPKKRRSRPKATKKNDGEAKT